MVICALLWWLAELAAGAALKGVSLSAAKPADILKRRAKLLKTKGIYFLYRVLQAGALPALLLYFVFRGLGNRGYWHSLPERFGFLPHSFRQTGPGAIWLHAVAMGEILACLEFARGMRAEFPHSRLFVSTSMLAGRATAKEKLSGIADGTGGGGYPSGADRGDAAALPRARGGAGRSGRKLEVRFHGAGGGCRFAGGATDRTRAAGEGLDRGQHDGRRTSRRRRRSDR